MTHTEEVKQWLDFFTTCGTTLLFRGGQYDFLTVETCILQALHLFYFRFAIFDTPGQIEVFTWSASGAIITEALASSFATVVVYIIDTARSTSPVTFMSNMLYACSILYKTKLPFIVVLNKVIAIGGNLITPILYKNYHTTLLSL